ncbi:MAG: hypothetical protein KIT14_18680 [bacterium]|nr:hypothetical protein [bacterium]
MMDPYFLERMVIGGFLAALAVGVAFGPELRRTLTRMRARTASDARLPPASLGAESATS